VANRRDVTILDERVRDLAESTLAWVRDLGVVLQSARGPVPNVAQFIAGEPIRGSWWGHAAGKDIYAVLNFLDESEDIVSTRLINQKLTLLHARIWPSVARVSELLGVDQLSAVHSEHTDSGVHRSFAVAFPGWVPDESLRVAATLSVEVAFAQLPECLRPSTNAVRRAQRIAACDDL
jgi:hypothetical protein